MSRKRFQTTQVIRTARVALFKGEPGEASEMLKPADRSLEVVNKVTVKHAADVKGDLLAIGGQLVVVDEFVDLAVKREHMAKAHEQFSKAFSNMWPEMNCAWAK